MDRVGEFPEGGGLREDFVRHLREAVGERAMPPAGSAGSPLAVRPACTAEVAQVVAACAAAGVCVVPRGGDTGLSGGTSHPTSPSITISLERMKRIVSVDPQRWAITAEAGVTVEALQEAAAAAGRKFAPDWGARGSATLGGAISTNAGGNNVLRYGTMRDSVLGIEAVLADGRVWDGRRALRKDSSGFDLKQLFIGGEGILGIVTSAVVKLVAATPHEQSALAAIDGLDSLTPLLELAHEHCGGWLTAFELMPTLGMRRVAELRGTGLPIRTASEYCVLVKLASGEPVTDRLAGLLDASADAGLVGEAVLAATAEQESSLWILRDELSPTRAFRDSAPHGLKLDVAVPIDEIARCIREVQALAAEIAPQALGYAFGHVGDGNLHLWILPAEEGAVEPFLHVRQALTEAVDAVVIGLGGTLSGEHGIGTLLRERIAAQKSPLEWELMRALKSALDPAGLFNPGKTLPPP